MKKNIKIDTVDISSIKHSKNYVIDYLRFSYQYLLYMNYSVAKQKLSNFFVMQLKISKNITFTNVYFQENTYIFKHTVLITNLGKKRSRIARMNE